MCKSHACKHPSSSWSGCQIVYLWISSFMVGGLDEEGEEELEVVQLLHLVWAQKKKDPHMVHIVHVSRPTLEQPVTV